MLMGLLQFLYYGLGAIGTLAGIAAVLLVAFQEKLVYVPVVPGQPGLERDYQSNPHDNYGLRYQDVWMTAEDGVKLHGWFIKGSEEIDGPTILFFQENAGNIAHRLDFVKRLLDRINCNIFMLSYRGYGASQGVPSQHGLQLDASAALAYLLTRDDVNPKSIVAFGRSLGGAVAAQLTYDHPDKVAALVLENTFTSVLDMASVIMPFLGSVIGGPGRGLKPLNFLVRNPWVTVSFIGKVEKPIFMVSGLLDEMVPPSHMQQLREACSSNPDVVWLPVPNGHHMDTWYKAGQTYWQELNGFLRKYAKA